VSPKNLGPSGQHPRSAKKSRKVLQLKNLPTIFYELELKAGEEIYRFPPGEMAFVVFLLIATARHVGLPASLLTLR
jgi:hypothetical protein